MTQLMAVAVAALFLGIGLAGEPLNPMHVLITAAILGVTAIVLGIRATPLVTFLVGFVGVLLACFLQHDEVYPGTGVVALALGALAASSYGRRLAPAVIAGLGVIVGIVLFVLL
jgi:hypothetical protein